MSQKNKVGKREFIITKTAPTHLINIPGMKQVLDKIYDDMNDIINAVNKSSTREARPSSAGKSGDVRLYKNETGKYFIEGKFMDGWAEVEVTPTKKVT